MRFFNFLTVGYSSNASATVSRSRSVKSGIVRASETHKAKQFPDLAYGSAIVCLQIALDICMMSSPSPARRSFTGLWNFRHVCPIDSSRRPDCRVG